MTVACDYRSMSISRVHSAGWYRVIMLSAYSTIHQAMSGCSASVIPATDGKTKSEPR